MSTTALVVLGLWWWSTHGERMAARSRGQRITESVTRKLFGDLEGTP